MSKKVNKNVPELRFPEFNGDWKTDKTNYFLGRYVNPVDVQLDTEYRQIGIRSHGRGIFHKEPVTGRELGNKRVYWVHSEAFTVNIVFAWEQAVALTSNAEKGFIASHRFLMFLPKENRADLKFILFFFLRKRGKNLLNLASPGGAGRNKTLGQDNFAELQITLPKKEEQEKIASFLGAIATRLTQPRRKHELLQTYKWGVMQKLFSQQIRFKQADRSDFPAWQKIILGKVTNIQKGEQLNKENLSKKGLYPCVNGGILPSGYTDNFNVNKNTITISEGGNSCGYVNFMKTEFWSGGHCYTLEVSDEVNKYFLFQNLKYQQDKIMALRVGSGLPNIQKKDLSKFRISIPLLLNEQERIADFLTAIDKKIESVAKQINLTEQFKKGLLQKMFV